MYTTHTWTRKVKKGRMFWHVNTQVNFENNIPGDISYTQRTNIVHEGSRMIDRNCAERREGTTWLPVCGAIRKWCGNLWEAIGPLEVLWVLESLSLPVSFVSWLTWSEQLTHCLPGTSKIRVCVIVGQGLWNHQQNKPAHELFTSVFCGEKQTHTVGWWKRVRNWWQIRVSNLAEPLWMALVTGIQVQYHSIETRVHCLWYLLFQSSAIVMPTASENAMFCVPAHCGPWAQLLFLLPSLLGWPSASRPDLLGLVAP